MDIIKDYIRTRYLTYMHIEPKNRNSYKTMKNYPKDKFKLFTFGDMMEKREIKK